MKKLFSGELIALGSFDVTEPEIRVSDPGYDRDVWCCGIVRNCKVGTWEAAVLRTDEGDWGVRNAVLAIRYADGGPKFNGINRAVCNATGAWKDCQIDVGVDSGQAGFFDEKHYQDESVFDGLAKPAFASDDIWYGHCCDITLSRIGAGVLPYGVVSSSGYGDGCYGAYKHLNREGQVDFLFVVFIEEDDEDEG